MVGLSFSGNSQNFLVFGHYNIKKIATNFLLLFFLHCHIQVVKIVTLIFRLFCLLQKCLLWTKMLKLLVKSVDF